MYVHVSLSTKYKCNGMARVSSKPREGGGGEGAGHLNAKHDNNVRPSSRSLWYHIPRIPSPVPTQHARARGKLCNPHAVMKTRIYLQQNQRMPIQLRRWNKQEIVVVAEYYRGPDRG